MNDIYTNIDDYNKFQDDYKKEEIEILALIGKGAFGASMFNNSWIPSIDFLAYVDLSTNELYSEKSRLNWIISDELNKENGCGFPYFLKDETIYQLRVRESKEEESDDSPWFKKKFMLVDVISENLQEARLNEILEKYKKPIVLKAEGLGELKLNKDLRFFQGIVNLLGKKVIAYLEVDLDDEETWQKSLAELIKLTSNIKEKDMEFKVFTAQELTELANEWAEEGTAEISEKDFETRISLSSLAVDCDGRFTVYYDDDDMFYGHAVTVYGENGVATSASI